jgi:hypothetical protein
MNQPERVESASPNCCPEPLKHLYILLGELRGAWWFHQQHPDDVDRAMAVAHAANRLAATADPMPGRGTELAIHDDDLFRRWLGYDGTCFGVPQIFLLRWFNFGPGDLMLAVEQPLIARVMRMNTTHGRTVSGLSVLSNCATLQPAGMATLLHIPE